MQKISQGLYFGQLSNQNEQNEYHLTTTNSLATIYGNNITSLFYGFQTLLQLFPPEIHSNTTVSSNWLSQPLVTINDYPKFSWRGVMVDTSRHFFPIPVLKQLIQAMSHYKLNILHLHLSDNQGWRLEINRYPNLTKYESKRASSPQKWDRYLSDNTPYGPYYYTEEDISELITYASQRMVTIVPEIELPGHAMSILSSYPQFACTSNEGPFVTSTTWGTNDDCVLCIGNDELVEFVENIIDEVIRIFSIKPGQSSVYIHIGGNEASRKRWKTCERCNQRRREQDLSYDQLQPWFIEHMSKYIDSKQVKVVGCDNILDNKGYASFELPKSALIMTWKSNGKEIAELGYDVVMNPSDCLYLDYSQFKAKEPYEYVGYTTTTKMVYMYNPLEEFTSSDEHQSFVKGAEASLWSEFIWESNDLFYKSFPRLLALSETVWCESETKSWERFIQSMERAQFDKLSHMGFDRKALTAAELSFKSSAWTPDMLSTLKWQSYVFPFTGAFNQKGQYEIGFVHHQGDHGIQIRKVRLLINQVVVGTDEHEGTAGNTGVNNFYTINVQTRPNDNDVIQVSAEIIALEGTDSYGTIYIYPAELRN